MLVLRNVIDAGIALIVLVTAPVLVRVMTGVTFTAEDGADDSANVKT